MKKMYLLLAVALGLFTMQANAQCGGGRYYDEIFANYEDTTVVYSTTNQSMNIYWPSGDVETVRPVIIFAHGGSFYAGDRNETTIVELCKRFAKRGYVTASIDYRLGSALDMFQESTAYPVVVQAISDGKAAVRYFRRYATQYGVDQNKIYFGGNSAGSILGIHLVYIADTAEAASDPTILAAINANGGIDGNSGNPGYSWHCSAMVDWAGGIKDTTWFGPGDPAIVSLHGNPDGTVPYECGQVLNGLSQVTLCGPGVFLQRVQNVGIGYSAKQYPGGDHQPWGGGGTGAIFNEADSITKEFLFNQVCNATGIKTITSEAGIEVYPNPANTIVNIKYEGQAKQISLIDGLGRTVFTTNSGFNTNNATINIENFAKGVYFVKVDDANGSVASRKLIVE
jgi:para-nitrobenzyl esterase